MLQSDKVSDDVFDKGLKVLGIMGRMRIVEAEQTEELWQKWKQPEIWRLPHGHISWMGAPGLTGRVLHWLSPRLNKPAVGGTQTLLATVSYL